MPRHESHEPSQKVQSCILAILEGPASTHTTSIVTARCLRVCCTTRAMSMSVRMFHKKSGLRCKSHGMLDAKAMASMRKHVVHAVHEIEC